MTGMSQRELFWLLNRGSIAAVWVTTDLSKSTLLSTGREHSSLSKEEQPSNTSSGLGIRVPTHEGQNGGCYCEVLIGWHYRWLWRRGRQGFCFDCRFLQ